MIKICMVGIFVYVADARVKGYAETLARAGATVDVLCVQSIPPKATVDALGVRIHAIHAPQAKKDVLSYILGYIYFYFLLAWRLAGLSLQNHYDVIHFHNMPDFLVFAGLLPKLMGAKIILDIHDPMPEVYLSKFPEERTSTGFRLMCLQEKLSASFADHVITANPHFRENLIKRGLPESKIAVIKNFPDPDLFDRSKYQAEMDQPRERFTLIFPGTIAPRYGLDVAVQALPIIRERIPKIKLLIIGGPRSASHGLISLAQKINVLDSLEIKPVSPNADIPLFLARADVGIYPALPDSHMSIAAPGKVLEFAAMGLPIISSRLLIVEEMFDDTAVSFFEPGNATDFARCVIAMAESPALRQEFIHHADQIFSQRHSGEQEMQTYWALLKHLLPRQFESWKELDERHAAYR